MKPLQSRPIGVEDRYQLQNQQLAIRDCYDAIVELVTNADDRYQVLDIPGRIEIEVARQRGGKPTILKVRDYADGMTAADMDRKIGWIGGRVSGLESGARVRGTNSRGAKDVAALGRVTFESLAGDGQLHRCEIERVRFTPYESEAVSAKRRKALGIAEGTGTVVTIEVEAQHKVPQHKKLMESLARLVALREILSNQRRVVVVRDLNQERENRVTAERPEGKARSKVTFDVPGYPAKAKLIIKRARSPFPRSQARFRQGAILVKASHAVHEATLFDSSLDNDPHAARFFGKLTCPYLDVLWNEYDNRMAEDLPARAENPCPVVDPMRKQGLIKDHPFVEALYGKALSYLRPLVEEERVRAEKTKATIENRRTRKRLGKLEQAAAEFMQEKQDDAEPARDPNQTDRGSKLQERGYTLSPPFLQVVVGHSARLWLNIRQKAFPELSVGSSVQIRCLTEEIVADRQICGLEAHPVQQGVLRALWNVRAEAATEATGVRVRVGPIVDEVVIEVLSSEADKYAHVKSLMFSRKTYRIPADGKKRKKLMVLAPLEMASEATPFTVECSSKDFIIGGSKVLRPLKSLGISRAEITVKTSKSDSAGTLKALLGDTVCSTTIQGIPPRGTGISIRLEDIDLGNQRYRWKSNQLEVAARHPALQRYLGSAASDFAGQEEKHFLVLLAEIVADAVCNKVLERREAAGLYEDDDVDFNFFSAELSRLMTEFAPKAHQLVVPK